MSERTGRILIVDDDSLVRGSHARLAGGLGYETETAADGVEALAKLALGVDLVLLDGQMPNMDGFEVARRIRATPGFEFLPIIMVSGLEGADEHRRALEVGINDFIQKPIDRDVLRLRSHWLLDWKASHDRLNQHKADLERTVEMRTAALREALEEMTEARRQIYKAHLDTIRRLTIAAEFKDEVTARHIERIGLYSSVIGEALDMSPGQVETVRHAAPLHDVGKLGIPDHVLLKPGKLDDKEWEVMRTHTTLGSEILAGSDSSVIQMGQTIARSHHERWDGSGYPEGLAGPEIPLEARICAVVDYFDALTMDRPYRRALDTDVVLGMMREGSGSHFDPDVLGIFFDRLPTISEIRSGYLAD
jgi:putative two-component system response regulator